MAVAFDLANLEVTGAPVPVLEGVSQVIHALNSGTNSGAAQFTFSESGTLAYIPGTVFPEFKNRAVWVDRNGEVEPTGIDGQQYLAARLHPDEPKVLLSTFYKDPHIWTYDLSRDVHHQQTLTGSNKFPIWSPDGSSFVFSSDRAGPRNLFVKAVDGGGEAEQLWPSRFTQTPASWSPDGELAYVQTEFAESLGHLDPHDGWVPFCETFSGDGSGNEKARAAPGLFARRSLARIRLRPIGTMGGLRQTLSRPGKQDSDLLERRQSSRLERKRQRALLSLLPGQRVERNDGGSDQLRGGRFGAG